MDAYSKTFHVCNCMKNIYEGKSVNLKYGDTTSQQNKEAKIKIDV